MRLLNYSLLSALTGLALCLAAYLMHSRIHDLLGSTGYLLTLLSVMAAAIVLWAARKPVTQWARSTLKRSQYVTAAAIFIAFLGISALRNPAMPKIYMDEAALVAVSQSMHNNRTIFLSLATFYNMEDGKLESADNAPKVVDKRPLLYPFLLSVLHDLTGYRLANAYILNYLAAFAFAMLFTMLAARLLPWPMPLIAPLIFLSIPIVGGSIASMGFEILNLTLIASTICCAMIFARTPLPSTYALLCASAGLLANVRYESILYSAIIPIVLWQQRHRLPNLRIHAKLLLPLFYLVPILVAVRHITLSEAFEIAHNAHNLPTDKPFDLAIFRGNIGDTFYYLLFGNNPTPISPAEYAGWWATGTLPTTLLLVGAVCAIGLMALNLRRPILQTTSIKTAIGACAVLLLHPLLMGVYAYGSPLMTITERLIIPTIFALALIAVTGIASAPRRTLAKIKGSPWAIFAIGAAIMTATGNEELLKPTPFVWEIESVAQHIKANYPPQSVCILAEPAVTYNIYDISAVATSDLNDEQTVSLYQQWVQRDGLHLLLRRKDDEPNPLLTDEPESKVLNLYRVTGLTEEGQAIAESITTTNSPATHTTP